MFDLNCLLAQLKALYRDVYDAWCSEDLVDTIEFKLGGSTCQAWIGAHLIAKVQATRSAKKRGGSASDTAAAGPAKKQRRCRSHLDATPNAIFDALQGLRLVSITVRADARAPAFVHNSTIMGSVDGKNCTATTGETLVLAIDVERDPDEGSAAAGLESSAPLFSDTDDTIAKALYDHGASVYSANSLSFELHGALLLGKRSTKAMVVAQKLDDVSLLLALLKLQTGAHLKQIARTCDNAVEAGAAENVTIVLNTTFSLAGRFDDVEATNVPSMGLSYIDSAEAAIQPPKWVAASKRQRKNSQHLLPNAKAKVDAVVELRADLLGEQRWTPWHRNVWARSLVSSTLGGAAELSLTVPTGTDDEKKAALIAMTPGANIPDFAAFTTGTDPYYRGKGDPTKVCRVNSARAPEAAALTTTSNSAAGSSEMAAFAHVMGQVFHQGKSGTDTTGAARATQYRPPPDELPDSLSALPVVGAELTVPDDTFVEDDPGLKIMGYGPHDVLRVVKVPTGAVGMGWGKKGYVYCTKSCGGLRSFGWVEPW